MRYVIAGIVALLATESFAKSSFNDFRRAPRSMPELQLPSVMSEMAEIETSLWFLRREEEMANAEFDKASAILTPDVLTIDEQTTEKEKESTQKISELTSKRIIILKQFSIREDKLKEQLVHVRERFVRLMYEIKQAELERMLQTSVHLH